MEPKPSQVTPKHRIKHRCGHFLGELRDGTFYIACDHCKKQSPLVLDRPSKELRIVQSEY